MLLSRFACLIGGSAGQGNWERQDQHLAGGLGDRHMPRCNSAARRAQQAPLPLTLADQPHSLAAWALVGDRVAAPGKRLLVSMALEAAHRVGQAALGEFGADCAAAQLELAAGDPRGLGRESMGANHAPLAAKVDLQAALQGRAGARQAGRRHCRHRDGSGTVSACWLQLAAGAGSHASGKAVCAFSSFVSSTHHWQ